LPEYPVVWIFSLQMWYYSVISVFALSDSDIYSGTLRKRTVWGAKFFAAGFGLVILMFIAAIFYYSNTESTAHDEYAVGLLIPLIFLAFNWGTIIPVIAIIRHEPDDGFIEPKTTDLESLF